MKQKSASHMSHTVGGLIGKYCDRKLEENCYCDDGRDQNHWTLGSLQHFLPNPTLVPEVIRRNQFLLFS